jgi:hypothetical protein
MDGPHNPDGNLGTTDQPSRQQCIAQGEHTLGTVDAKTLEPYSSYHARQHPSHVQHPLFQAGNYPPQSPRRPSEGPTGTLLQRSRNFAGIQRNAHLTTEYPTTPRHYTSIGTNRQRNHPRHPKLSPLQQADGIHS